MQKFDNMTDIVILILKDTVFAEVGRLTNYAGSKMDGDEGAFQRVSTTGSDKDMLGQFWQQACDGVTEALKRFIKAGNQLTDGYEVTLELSSSFDTSLSDSLQANLQSYITLYIVSRWYKLTNKGDAESYATEAAVQLDEAMSKVFYKKKPTRKSIRH